MQSSSDPMNDLLSGSGWISELGPAFIIGLAVGYFAKKVFRIGLFLFGAIVVVSFLLDQSGLFHVSTTTLESMASGVGDEAVKAGGFLRGRLDGFSGKGLSAGAGFLTGLKIG